MIFRGGCVALSKRLAIVQDYVPKYRYEFFDRLVERLAADQISCVVIAADAPGALGRRGDSIDSAEWFKRIEGPTEVWPLRAGPAVIRTGPRIFGYGSDRHWRDFDGVIMGLRGSDLDLYVELLRKRSRRRVVGVWGHISRPVNPPNALDVALERWQMRHSNHVFAYTKDGYDSATRSGVAPAKVTAVMNSIDVSALIESYSGLRPTDVENFQMEHSLIPGKTFGYIGGLDSAKRIDFLADVLDSIWRTDREIKLIVGGRGEDQKLLAHAEQRGQVVMLGYAGASEKAVIARVSQALVNPGRVGLLAVEALCLGIPVLTTEWPFHAPEFDYLENGVDVFLAANNASDFARLIESRVNHDLTVNPKSPRKFPRVEDMVDNFATGVRRMFS